MSGPTLPKGNAVRRFPTIPVGHNVSHAAKSRRIKTSNVDRDETFPVNLEALQRHVYNTVISRLQQSSIVVDELSHLSLAFMMPQGGAPHWELLLSHPMLLTDVELKTILTMESSTVLTPHPVQGSHIFYIRSFRLTVNELLAVIASWEENEVYLETCWAWKEATEWVRDLNEDVFVRYVGASSVVSAWTRYTNDLQYRTDGIYTSWMEALAKLFPHVIQTVNVYSFPQAATRAFRTAQGRSFPLDVTQTDIREQALIALFGHDTLLNKQPGGFHTSYQPDDADIALFQKLGCKGFSTLRAMASTDDYQEPTLQMQNAVVDYVHQVAALGDKYPEELGTNLIPVTYEMEFAWLQQSLPATFFGQTPFLLVGDYLPQSAMYNPGPFWFQPARAVRYLKDTLSRLEAYESGLKRWNPAMLNPLVNDAALPFIDYQYTPRRQAHREESAELMRQYFELVQPLIIVTLERGTSSIVRGNFVGLWSSKDFLPQVGEPKIQYWTHPGKVTGLGNRSKAAEHDPDPDHCFVQIPSFHTGMDKYTDQPKELRRIIDMTWWQVDCCIDIALDNLNNGWQGSQLELCEDVQETFQSRWKGSGCAAVFQKAKKDLADWFSNKPSRWTKDPNRAFKTQLNGTQVAVNLSGIVTMYWTKPGGKQATRITLGGGRETNVHPPKGAAGDDAIRTVHFLPTGVDIRDHAGNSCTYKRKNKKPTGEFTDPTFPGDVIRSKLEEAGTEGLRELWDAETGLNFDQAFPSDNIGPSTLHTKQRGTPGALPAMTGSKVNTGRTSRLNAPGRAPATTPTPASGTTQGRQSPLKKLPATPTPTPGTTQARQSPVRRTPTTTTGYGATQSRQARQNLQTPGLTSASGFLPPISETPKGKGKAKEDGADLTEVSGKCRSCRLNGVFCNGGAPCSQCARKGLQCDYRV